ncbi:MAG: hypothetical protein LQ337_003913 [Flavoplaca oasis]|nr:MAG: hypothetical protein LQ337_003913 [Flavoplaca oasis]
MTLKLWLVVILLRSVYSYAIAPSCDKVNEHNVNLRDWIRESYSDAMRMAAGANFDVDQDQGLDDTRDIMFPGMVQIPRVLQYVKAVYGRASANRQDYQETATPRNSPDINVIFYCGDETFVNMGAENENNRGWYYDPWSNTAYYVGTDRSTPCGGSLAVTGQGVDRTTGKANRFGIILCNVIDRGSLASVERTLEHDSDLINDGADIDRLENQREGEKLEEVYTFVGATDFARASLDNAIKNIDNYVYYALSRRVGGIYWQGGRANTIESVSDDNMESE